MSLEKILEKHCELLAANNELLAELANVLRAPIEVSVPVTPQTVNLQWWENVQAPESNTVTDSDIGIDELRTRTAENLLALVNNGHRDKAVNILKRFDAKTLTMVSDDNLKEVSEYINAALAEV